VTPVGPIRLPSTGTDSPACLGEAASTRVSSDAALLFVALAAGLGSLRLTTSPTAVHLVLSVVATVLAGHSAVSIVERVRWLRARRPLALAAGISSVALVTTWISVPSATRYGFPTTTTFHALFVRFEEAGRVITSRPTPLSPTPGVVLCLIAGAGLAAVIARSLWSWAAPDAGRSTPTLVALTPTFGLFAYCSVLSSDVDRVEGAIAYVAAATVFLVAADRPTLGTPERHRLSRSGVFTGLSTGALAIVIALAFSPSLSGMRLDALPYSSKGVPSASSGPGSGPGGSLSASSGADQTGVGPLALIDDLHGVLTERSQQVMFNARTLVPTYWQLATLTTFTGSQWIPDSATEAAVAGTVRPDEVPSVPVLPQPSKGSTYEASVSLVGLESALLPVPPTTVSLSGRGSRIDPSIGALYSSSSGGVDSQYGFSYTAVARTPVTPESSDPSGPSNPSGPAVAPADLAPYLALPSSLSAAVISLAHEITAGITSPFAQAEAIARWFDGGLFRYTLDPPQTQGADPLTAFLFDTRAGFCQQFAGAYGVLARLNGLPTRLAVGFATGTASRSSSLQKKGPSSSYRVTGADAHVWPEVYLGPAEGWVSFEPTPPASGEPDGVGVLEGGAPLPPAGVQSTTSTTSAPSPRGTLNGSRPHDRKARARDDWAVPAVMLVAIAILAVAALTTLAIGIPAIRPRQDRRRRTRWGPLRRRKGGGASNHPNVLVMGRLDRASRTLSGAGLGRMEAETLAEHVERLRARTTLAGLGTMFDSYEALVRLAERASYAADPCSEEEATEALRLCDSVCSSLRSQAASPRRRTGAGGAPGARIGLERTWREPPRAGGRP